MIELLVVVAGLVALNAFRARIGDLSKRLLAAEMEIAGLRQALNEQVRRQPPPDGVATTPEPQADDETPSRTTDAEPSEAPRWTSTPIVPSAPAESGPRMPQLPRPDAAAAPEPAQTAGLEERLGTRWAVYAGGLALALGGIFLVRYSIEAGLIGPAVRVVLGALLAMALIGAGEWFRRGEIKLGIEALPEAHIPSVLTAAGTVTAFATIYAAHALYGFIGAGSAFVLLGVVGIATMLAAALHGPALAGLGLAGSFLTPLLVASESPSPWPVVLFLAVVSAAAMLLARARGWVWLAATAVAGSVLWGLALLADQSAAVGMPSWALAAMSHTVVQLVLAIVLLAIEPHAGREDAEAEPDWVAGGALAALAVLALVVLLAAPFDGAWWIAFAALVIALLATTGYVRPSNAIASVLAGIVLVGTGLIWPGLSEPAPATLLAPDLAGMLRLPENISLYLWLAAVAALLVTASATARLSRGAALPAASASLLALAATATPLVMLIVTYLRVTQFDHSIPFATAAVLLAAMFAMLVDRLDRHGEPTASHRIAAGAFAAAAVAGLSLALVAAFERGYLTVAFALAAFGTALVASRRDLPSLRHAVSALGLIVLARVVWDPRIMGSGIGSTPILNWLLLGYGVPAAAFSLSARLLAHRGEDLAVRVSDALGVLFAALLAYFQIRHAINGDPLAATSGHVEQGLLALTSVLFSYVLQRLNLARANPVFEAASVAFAGLALVFVVLGLGLFYNPLFSGEHISGGLVLSSILVAYLPTAIATLYVARASRGVRPGWYTIAAAAVALALIFAFVSLEVRHAFHGASISITRHTSSSEMWAYTAAWLMLAIAFLAYGLARRSLEARIASALLIAVVAIKVVVFDLAGVDGLWRALSFLCLGAVLVGIGLVYQRLVFVRTPPAASDGG